MIADRVHVAHNEDGRVILSVIDGRGTSLLGVFLTPPEAMEVARWLVGHAADVVEERVDQFLARSA